MITTANPNKTVELKDKIQDQSLKFAEEFESPDFVLIKEALLIFECLLSKTKLQVEGESPFDNASDKDKRYLFTMMMVLVKHFGTNDLEWFQAAEAVINALFNLKSRNSHEYARMFLQQLQSRLHEISQQGDNRSSLVQVGANQKVTDLHFAQLFFVVGHVAIKMLSFVEMLENDLKRAINFKKGSGGQQNAADGRNNEQSEQDEDLAQITGGNDAEIESYCTMLQKITEEKLIQQGYIG